MRLFIAAVLPQELIEALSETTALLRESVRGRFVAPDMLHVTLAFLGDISSERIPDVTFALDEGVAGHDAFETRLGELGYFGRARNATLWQGFVRQPEGRDPWGGLARDVRSALRDAGMAFDGKSFIPHVTLMRGANIDGAGMLPMPVVAAGLVSRVALFKSDLSGPHPVYEDIESFELG